MMRAYVLSGWAFGLSLLVLWLARGMFTAGVMLFVIGVTSGAFTTLNGAVLLRNTDPRYMGRVMSLAMLAFGGFGLIGIPVGLLADAVGEGETCAIMGVLVCLVVGTQSVALSRVPATVPPPAPPSTSP
jgi:MFS family permease